MDTTPYWYKLLDVWVNELDNAGLSIPFIVGVDRQYAHDFHTDTELVGALLEAIFYGGAFEQCLSLEYCETIQAYRFGLVDRADALAPYFANANNEPTLVCRIAEFGRQGLTDIIALMTELYGQNI